MQNLKMIICKECCSLLCAMDVIGRFLKYNDLVLFDINLLAKFNNFF